MQQYQCWFKIFELFYEQNRLKINIAAIKNCRNGTCKKYALGICFPYIEEKLKNYDRRGNSVARIMQIIL